MYHLQLPDVAAGFGPPDRICVIHHGLDDLFTEQHTASPVKGGPSTLILKGAFFPTWLTCVDQVSCVSRETRRYRADSTHSVGSPRNSTALGFDASRGHEKGHGSAL
jgi:hypothetical protein